MGQVTIYLDDNTLAHVKKLTKNTGVSQSQWIAEAVRLRLRSEWPEAVRALAGAWPDFPSQEEIRRRYAPDAAREEL
jgi:hypothetical protein